MSKLRFCAGITLYNPSEENIRNIYEYKSSFEKIFIYNNSEKIVNIKILEQSEKFIIISENKNDGLPKAYNKILKICQEENIDFLCTLDQDSFFSTDDISAIKKLIENNFMEWRKKVAIIAPYIEYKKSYEKKREKRISEINEKKWVITSGSFLNIKLLKEYELNYDENYFIDKFEIDLCKKIILKKLKIYMYLKSVLYQELGEKNSKNKINHNPLRHYYLFRNRFYFNNKFYTFPKKYFLNIAQTLRHIFMIIFNEDDKLKKLKMFVKAYKDYKKNKMGEVI